MACPECGLSGSLVSEFVIMQEQFVCTGCGYLDVDASKKHGCNFEQDELVPASSAFPSSNGSNVKHLASKLKYSDSKRETGIKIAAKDRLKDLASNYGLTTEMRREAEQLFEEALDERLTNFRKTLNEHGKIILAGCCVYIVSRRHDRGVPITYLASYLVAPRNLFIRILRKLMTALELRVDCINLNVLAASYLRELTLEANEMQKMTRIISDLIDIAKRTLVMEGVNAQPFLSAATYIAWCCFTFPPRKEDYSVFCKKVGAIYNTTTKIRLNELNVLLIELSKSIPWLVGTQVTKKNVFMHLETILKYRKTLVFSRETNDKESDLYYQVVNKRLKRRMGSASSDPVACTSTAWVDDDQLLLSENLTEDDLPDDQMWKYLRTPKEIEYINSLKTKNGVE